MAMPIQLAFLCILQLVFGTSAFAQEAPITDCDKYAAWEFDTQRKAAGVPADQMNPALAVPACETAVQQYPNSTRLRSQLGRAYYNANNFPAAVEQYRKAADQSSVGGVKVCAHAQGHDGCYWVNKSNLDPIPGGGVPGGPGLR
jgi:tetratricopeptide (TPR) repeat protein